MTHRLSLGSDVFRHIFGFVVSMDCVATGLCVSKRWNDWFSDVMNRNVAEVLKWKQTMRDVRLARLLSLLKSPTHQEQYAVTFVEKFQYPIEHAVIVPPSSLATFVELAVARGWVEIAHTLLKQQHDTKTKTLCACRIEFLHAAIASANVRMVKLLLANGTSPCDETTNDQGMTSLDLAMRIGSWSERKTMLSLLLATRRVNVASGVLPRYRRSPMAIAILGNDPVVVRALVMHDSTLVEAPVLFNNAMVSPVELAIETSNYFALSTLIECGARITEQHWGLALRKMRDRSEKAAAQNADYCLHLVSEASTKQQRQAQDEKMAVVTSKLRGRGNKLTKQKRN